jgi:hypothetical protein
MVATPEETAGGNEVRFVLPSLPGSVNEIYELNRPDSGLPRRRLRAEWAIWATRMMQHIPLFLVATDSVVRVDRCYYYPWFYKNGKWKRVDTSNMDKLLFDTIAKKIGIDDLYFKCGWMDSRDSSNPRVEVTLTEIVGIEWERQRERMT